MLRMEMILSIAALIGVGAITPGPNNLAVLNAAARSGFAGAFPAITGIIAGSLALFLLVAVGGATLFDASPRQRALITLGGCLYLAYLGARLIGDGMRGSMRSPATVNEPPRLEALELMGFQFLNPKGWALVLTVSSAAQAADAGWLDQAAIAGLFVAIPAACLSAWSLCGSLLTTRLARRGFRAGFDGAMGSVLLASALLLLYESTVR
jgi:threonine/homoserine/homoserine lactone efflux protein